MRPSRSPTLRAVAGGERVAEVAVRPRRRVDLRLERRDVGEVVVGAAAARRRLRNGAKPVGQRSPSKPHAAPRARRWSAPRDGARTAAARARRRRPRRPPAAAARARRSRAPSGATSHRPRASARRCARASGYAAKPSPAPNHARLPAATTSSGCSTAARASRASARRRARRRRRRPRASARRGRRRRASPPCARNACCASASSVGTGTTGRTRPAPALRDAARDAHAGERAGTGAERDAVEIARAPAALGEHGVDQRQQRARECAWPACSRARRNSSPSPHGDGSHSVEQSNARTRIGRGFMTRDLPEPRAFATRGYNARGCRRRSSLPRERRMPRACPDPVAVDDRIARPGGPRHRARRRQGRLRRRRAARRARRRSRRSSASRRYEIARAVAIQRASAVARRRRAARTSASAAAARCSTRHPALQVAAKQRALEDALARIGRVRPARLLPPIARARVAATGIARGCRCATCAKRAACWSASTSASRASSPT